MSDSGPGAERPYSGRRPRITVSKSVLGRAIDARGTLAAMSPRRSTYDALAVTNEPRWLVVRDMCRAVLEHRELPPGTDLRAAFVKALAAHADAGWQLRLSARTSRAPSAAARVSGARSRSSVRTRRDRAAPGTGKARRDPRALDGPAGDRPPPPGNIPMCVLDILRRPGMTDSSAMGEPRLPFPATT